MSGIGGSLAGGFLSDLAGRRTVLLLATLPFLFGLVLLGLANSLPTILLSRAIQERTALTSLVEAPRVSLFFKS